MQVRDPADYELKSCTAECLAGADAEQNARALESVLLGRDRGPHRDCLVLGTALALEVSGRVRSPREGVELASSTIDSGQARGILQTIANFSKRPGAQAMNAAL